MKHELFWCGVLSEKYNGSWVVGVVMVVGIVFLIIFIIIYQSMNRSRSVVFERDEAGRITAIHYV
jgi:hypothetical protein